MRRRAIAVLLLAACAPDADAPIFLSGVARDAAGAPIAGLRVDLAELPWDEAAQVTRSWRPVASATTDDDGRYTLTVRAGVLRPGVGSRQTMRVSTSALDDVLFTASFDGELPPLEHWDAGFAITDGRASFTPAPLRDGENASLHALELVSDDDVLWRVQVQDPTSHGVPAVPIEDAPDPRWRVRAWRDGERVYAPVRANGASIEWCARSVSTAIEATGDRTIPLSRGRPCFLDERPFEGCPITDGSMRPVLLAPDGAHTGHRITIALEAPHRVSRVVMRGLRSWQTDELIVEGVTGSGATVELARAAVALDASNLLSLHVVDGVGLERWIDLPVTSREPVERVIVRGTVGGEPAWLSAAREFSVF